MTRKNERRCWMNEQDEKTLRAFVETLSDDKLYFLHDILIDEMNARKSEND